MTSWTVSLGQSSDSVKCYTPEELRKIAVIITERHEYQDLLDDCDKLNEIKDSLIVNYREQIAGYKAIAPLKDTTVILQDLKINYLQDELKKTKKYWLYSSGGLFILAVLLIL